MKGTTPMDLGPPTGEPLTRRSRRCVVVVREHENGWSIVGSSNMTVTRNGDFRAEVLRCVLPAPCNRECLGHPSAVLKLAEKIARTY